MNDDPQYREDPAVVGYDVAAYEAAGVARVEERDEECYAIDVCDCTTGACTDPDDWCSHCREHCCCTPCEYGRVA